MQLRPAVLEADQAADTLLEHRHMESRWRREPEPLACATSLCDEPAQLGAIKGDAGTSISKKFDKYLAELTQLA